MGIVKKWFMQKQKINELEWEIVWCRNEIESRQARIKQQGDKINELLEEKLGLEDDKKALLDLVKSEIKP